MKPSQIAEFFCKDCGQQSDTVDALKEHEQSHKGDATSQTQHGHSTEHKTNLPSTSRNSSIITFVLTLLTVVTLTQGVYSYRALAKLKSGSASAASPLPSTLQNLPDMVGGC